MENRKNKTPNTNVNQCLSNNSKHSQTNANGEDFTNALYSKEIPPNKNETHRNTELPQRVDISALVGLRGLASLHILVFHVLLFCPLEINTMGSIQMPLFFLVSGFSLAVTYGRTTWDGNTSCCCSPTCCCCSPTDKDGATLMKTSDFYRNRFARVGLIYFLANLINCLLAFGTSGVYSPEELPIRGLLINGDIGSVIGVSLVFVLTLTGTGTWLLGFPILFSGSSWTICTLMFFYLLFPNLLPRLQKYTDEQLSKWITILYFIQLLAAFPKLLLHMVFDNETADWIYWPATAWPVSRLPVFIMGVLAGLQCLRGVHHPGSSCCINNVIPWSCSPDPQEPDGKEIIWSLRVDGNSVFIIFSILMFSVMEFYGAVDGPVPQLSRPDFNFYSQFLLIHMLLTIIVGLTSDGGRSFLSKVCHWKPVQLLGRISMSLYLIHAPVMDLIRVSYYGVNHCTEKQYQLWSNQSQFNNITNSTQFQINQFHINPNDTEYDGTNTTSEGFANNTACATFVSFHSSKDVLPLWAVPLVLVLCPALAWIITVFLEEPVRAKIRVKPKQSLIENPTTTSGAPSISTTQTQMIETTPGTEGTTPGTEGPLHIGAIRASSLDQSHF